MDEAKLTQKIYAEFPELSEEGVLLVREIINKFTRLHVMVKSEEPTEEKAQALVAQIVAFLRVSKV